MGKASRIPEIMALFETNESLNPHDIARGTGMHLATAKEYLRSLFRAGDLVREHVAGQREYQYALPPQKEQGEIVPPPYRNLRLNETLTGYEDGINRFWSLCMLVRK